MSILFKEVSYTYDENMPFSHTALKNINLEINKNKITMIIGKTGSGKSSLIQHLNGLLLPTKGEVIIDEYTLKNKNKFSLKNLRKKVGIVFQFAEYQLFEETVLKDVMFGPKNFGYSQEEARRHSINALKLVGIREEFFDLSPFELSGGQKRRIAIASILSFDPEIIIFDEPTVGLDPSGRELIKSIILDLNKSYNKTIIVVTHDYDLVNEVGEFTVLLKDGQIEFNGKTKDLFRNQKLIEENEIDLPKILKFKNILIEKGFQISEDANSLNEIIKEVTK